VDVNWGIRFTEAEQATNFMKELSQELSKRILKNGAKGKKIVFKVKINKQMLFFFFQVEKKKRGST
jgi:hypothetical protein